MEVRSRIFQGIVGLACLGGLLVGVPTALWKLAGWPLPHGIPSLHELGDALERE